MELEILFRELVEALRSTDPKRLHQPHRLRDIQYGLIPYRDVRDTLELSCSEDHEMLLLRMCSGEGGFFEIPDTEALKAFDAEVEGVNPDLNLLHVYGETEVRLASDAIDRALAGPAEAGAARYAPPSEEDDEAVRVIPLSTVPIPPPVPEPMVLHTPIDPPPTADRESEPDHLPLEVAEQEPAELEPAELEPDADPEPDWGGPPPPSGRDTSSTGLTPPPFSILPEEPTPTRCDFCGAGLPTDRKVNFCPHCGQNLALQRCLKCSAEIEWGWRHCINCGQAVEDA